jgi:hypothetical protein
VTGRIRSVRQSSNVVARRARRGEDRERAVTDAEYLEITRSEDYDALMAHCKRVMSGG